MMIIGGFDLPVMEEMAFAEIEPDPFIPAFVSHAMVLANRGIEAGPVHERNPGACGDGHDPGFRLNEIIFGGRITDFA